MLARAIPSSGAFPAPTRPLRMCETVLNGGALLCGRWDLRDAIAALATARSRPRQPAAGRGSRAAPCSSPHPWKQPSGLSAPAIELPKGRGVSRSCGSSRLHSPPGGKSNVLAWRTPYPDIRFIQLKCMAQNIQHVSNLPFRLHCTSHQTIPETS
ncbi:hypothetical protein FKM82_024759 [Ascaphus truei]